MYIAGIWFPVTPSLWCIFAGIVIGFLIGRVGGVRAGYEQAKHQMEQQQFSQAYMAYIKNMMGGQ